MPKFPPLEELQTMPLSRLRLIDINSQEEEEIVQDLIDQKIEDKDGPENIYRGDVPDIQTPEQEAEWQKKIDSRTARAKKRKIRTSHKVNKAGNTDTTGDVITTPVPGGGTGNAPTPVPSTTEELVDYTLTEADFELKPELAEKGFQVGDVIKMPAQATEGTATVTTDKTAFCDFCTSKGGFHKRECPTRKV